MAEETVIKHVGRISPFHYRQVKYHEEAESLNEALSDALLKDGLRGDGAIPWLLDIRYNPESSSPQGTHLKHIHPKQYRHARGLGVKDGRLFYPSSAIREILKMLRAGEVFVLLSDNEAHVKQVEALIRNEATGVALEDPYAVNAGDLCTYAAPSDSPLWPDRTQIFLHHRIAYVYRFLAYDLAESCSNYVDIRDLTIVEAGKYRCGQCQKGEKTVMWREPAGRKLCKHCFWLWEMDRDE